MIKAIVAHDPAGLIGANGTLPWDVASDLAYFKEITMSHVLLMGRITFESIGKVLPGRTSIVLTSDTSYHVDHPNVIVVHDLQQTLNDYKDAPVDLFVIGGASVYEQAMPMIEQLHVSLIPNKYQGDTYFPSYEDLFECISTQDKQDFTLKIFQKRGKFNEND